MALVNLVGQQLAHYAPAALEGRHGIELWRHVNRRAAGAPVTRPGPVRQYQRRQHVSGGGGRADDVQADRIGTVAMAGLHDRLEHRQRAPTQGIEGLSRTGVAGQHVDQARMLLGRAPFPPLWIVEPLCDHGVVHAGMLAQIERRQVESESVDAR